MEKTGRIIEMAEWLVEHPWHRDELCNDSFVVSDEEFLKVFQDLEEKGYYELLLVFLIKQSYELDSVERTLTKFWIRRVMNDWRQQGSAPLFREFRELFQTELSCRVK